MEADLNRKLIVLLIVLAGLTAYTYPLRYRRAVDPRPPRLEMVRSHVGGFHGRDEYQEPESLKLLGADRTLFRSYTSEDHRTVWLFMGYFASQQENSQIHSPKHCYPGSGWNIIGEGTTAVNGANGPVSVRHLYITDGREKRVVLYWFSTRRGIVTNEFALKWYQMESALTGKPQSATFIRFSARVEPGEDEETTRRLLISFAEKILPGIETVLGG